MNILMMRHFSQAYLNASEFSSFFLLFRYRFGCLCVCSASALHDSAYRYRCLCVCVSQHKTASCKKGVKLSLTNGGRKEKGRGQWGGESALLGVFRGALRLKMQAGNANSHGKRTTHSRTHKHTYTHTLAHTLTWCKRKTFKRYLFECK